MRSKQTDALLTEISELRAEVERLTRERDEARVQLNMTKGEAENDYRQLERDKDAEIERLEIALDKEIERRIRAEATLKHGE